MRYYLNIFFYKSTPFSVLNKSIEMAVGN